MIHEKNRDPHLGTFSEISLCTKIKAWMCSERRNRLSIKKWDSGWCQSPLQQNLLLEDNWMLLKFSGEILLKLELYTYLNYFSSPKDILRHASA